MTWSLQEYCASQTELPWDTLAESSRLFLDKLGLPFAHPYCENPSLFDLDGIPPMGPTEDAIYASNWEATITFLLMTIPPFVAFLELWIRLLSGVVGPVGLVILTWEEQQHAFHLRPPKSRLSDRCVSFASVCTVGSSVILMTDSLYVFEYGSYYGITLFCASIVFAARACWRRQLWRSSTLLVLLVGLAFVLTWDWRDLEFHFGEPADVNLNVKPGLYYNPDNALMNLTVSHWPQDKRTYTSASGATPWMYTGDARTGLPFFLNAVPDPHWNRIFLPLDDGEVLALDVAFPPTGHNASQPIYLLLHGVNGGSEVGYLQDLAWRRTRQGSTVVCMISRGLADVPLRGWDIFHAARISDVHATATALRRLLSKNQLLVGVGYSMGAIVLNNYVSRSGSECALDAAFSISGALEPRFEQNFARPQRLWLPMIADGMRTDQHLSKWGQRMRARLSHDEYVSMLRATHVVELDKYTAVAYYGYRNLDHYYAEQSALGDLSLTDLKKSPKHVGRANIYNITTPLCILHALEDPISTWRTIVANDGFMRPQALVREGNSNLLFLLTKTGGHVGWPVGWFSWVNQWQWMSDAAASFVDAIAAAKEETAAAN